MRFICGYVKEHKLRDKQDRKTIKSDKNLRDALDCETFTHMTLGSKLNQVSRAPDPDQDADIMQMIIDHDKNELAKKKLRPAKQSTRKRPLSEKEPDKRNASYLLSAALLAVPKPCPTQIAFVRFGIMRRNMTSTEVVAYGRM